MMKFLNLILKMFFFICLTSCIFSYLNMDPMKSSFFLIFTLLCSAPLVSFMSHVWFSYFICLLFLSGIFVILVYFSSLSKISFLKAPGSFFVFLLSLILFYPSFFLFFSRVSMNNFYYDVYWSLFVWLVLVLLLFMNFTSYFLNFSGALRKL